MSACEHFDAYVMSLLTLYVAFSLFTIHVRMSGFEFHVLLEIYINFYFIKDRAFVIPPKVVTYSCNFAHYQKRFIRFLVSLTIMRLIKSHSLRLINTSRLV